MAKKILITATVFGLGLSAAVAVATMPQVQGAGSSFNETWKVASTTPKISEKLFGGNFGQIINEIDAYGTEENPRLPKYSSKLSAGLSIISGAMKAAAKRTVETKEDY